MKFKQKIQNKLNALLNNNLSYFYEFIVDNFGYSKDYETFLNDYRDYLKLKQTPNTNGEV